MRLTILLSLMALVAVPVEAAAISGVWSNVRVNDTNGETRGVMLAFHDGAEASVTVTDCEKQCGAGVTVPVRIDGRKFSFRVDLGRGALSRFSGEFRDDGTVVLRGEGRLWNAQVLRPEGVAAREDTPPPLAAPGVTVVPSLAGMTFAVEDKAPKPIIRVVAKENAGAARFAGFYSNIVYREGAEHTQGMAIDFRPGKAPVVVMHDCDLYCEHTETVPVRVRGYRISYTLKEDMRDWPANGRRFTGEFRADGTLKVWGEGYRQFARVLRPKAKE